MMSNVSKQLDDSYFPKKEVVSVNFDKLQSFIENSIVHITSAPDKQGILESKENYVRLILGLPYTWISTASMSIKSHIMSQH